MAIMRLPTNLKKNNVIANVAFHNIYAVNAVMRKIIWKESIMDPVFIGLTIIELLCNENKKLYNLFIIFMKGPSRCKFLLM